MLYILCNNSLKSFLCAVIEKCCFWSHHSCIMWDCDYLIIHNNRKNDSYIINSDNNDDVITEVSIREEENSEENLIRKKNKDRKNKEKNEILSDNLKEAEKEENIIFINRKICWDNSVSDKLINWL